MTNILWTVFWAIPLRALGFIYQNIKFVFWSISIEFKVGATFALRDRLDRSRKNETRS